MEVDYKKAYKEVNRELKILAARSSDLLQSSIAAVNNYEYEAIGRQGVERIIMQHTADGLSTSRIATKLGKSYRTIDTYLYRLYKRYGAKNKPHLVAIYFRKGLIK